MLDSRLTARVAVATAVILLALQLFGRSRQERTFARMRSLQDSLIKNEQDDAQTRATLLQDGDSLPDVRLQTATGERMNFGALPASGVKYIYVYRQDCSACKILDMVLRRLPKSEQDSIAFVTFQPDSTVPAEPLPRHYSWVQSAASHGRYFRWVPSVLVVDSNGRIVSAAQGSSISATNLLDLYGVVRKREVDSLAAWQSHLIKVNSITVGERRATGSHANQGSARASGL